MRRELSQGTGWNLSYVHSVGEDEVNGVWAPRTWDQRHAFRASITHKPNDWWDMNFGFEIHSGWPITPREFEVTPLANGDFYVEHQFGKYNADRLPVYHRLDARVTRYARLGGGMFSVYIDIFNVLNRRNVRGNDFGTSVSPTGVLTVRRQDDELLPLLPTFGLRWDF